ncbi:hypothetical protein DFQ28_006038 [Apophysomyces sp. BC1034]|nr:hypothetical protein DFQ30_006034 [Apophysomyces sp. BC1015]KAG0177340.1 hypothetical protein DFQ29_004941 [Apophysomyces sp. BC1021]KAG0187657.1 hypothetical protein DFQ28_006038 [Apophysomyces sp. BC1034]
MHFSALSSLALALVAAVSVQAAPLEARVPKACLGFRITSPTQAGLQWTYGQCYAVSWDVAASTVKTIKSVDLYDAKTNKKVVTEVKNIPASKGWTENFQLQMGDDLESGSYYFKVIADAGSTTCTLDSVKFHVDVNPNSPPSQC